MTMAPEASRELPRLADGVELIGEYEGSGFKEPPSLVRRGDGQVIQLPPLLYQVAAKADGSKTYEDLAREVSAEMKRGLDAGNVRFLVDEKLRPLGILTAADGSQPPVEKADPFLGLKFRAALIPESVSNGLGTLFKPLFSPLLVLAALAALVAADWWLFSVHGLAQAIRQSLYHPGLFLPLFAAIILSAAFHEIGHAAGCRYGGGRAGKMGCGLYLAWPAFYTDVTDAYRLGRRARLRTDLGGVYFNVVVVLTTMGAYVATRFEPLLVLILVQHFEIVHQLLPVVRLDGYYIVADLTGVPDLFGRIKPILRSLIPGTKADEQVTVLKPWVRAAVTSWVLIVVPLLIFELFVMLVNLPRILGTAWDSGVDGWHAAGKAFGTGDTLAGIGGSVQLVVLAIPIVGILLMLAKTAKGGGGWVWRRTEGKPVARGVTVAVLAAGMGSLGYAWVSPHNYTPIRPGERGTVADSARAVRNLTNIPKTQRPAATASTTTTTEPETTTTVAPRRGGAAEPSPSTTAAATTTTANATTTTRPPSSTTTAP